MICSFSDGVSVGGDVSRGGTAVGDGQAEDAAVRSDKEPQRGLSFLSSGLFVLEPSASLLLGVGTCSEQSWWFPLTEDTVQTLHVPHVQDRLKTENLVSFQQNWFKNSFSQGDRPEGRLSKMTTENRWEWAGPEPRSSGETPERHTSLVLLCSSERRV